jgi:hydroxymethylbilane synthase
VKRVRIGTRGSTLALAQARWVKGQIEARGDTVVELAIIKTSGDRFVDAAIQSIGGKGVFTKEIEDALLRKEVDLAVHSMKDLPTELPAGLAVIAVPKREDPRDVLVSATGKSLADLPSGARLGTASLRRRGGPADGSAGVGPGSGWRTAYAAARSSPTGTIRMTRTGSFSPFNESSPPST